MGDARAAVVAGLVGFAMMSLELTAIRIMAPHFGDSAYVWTNVIGVMLVALALGAFLGGRWAGLPDPQRRLSRALVVAGGLAAVTPFVVGPLGAWLVPQTLPLEAAMAALVRGSLACTLVLFAPAVLLLGVATPMLVAMLVAAGRPAGRASGLVSAISTLGSLLGTFAATHLLVPGLGSRMTVWVCAALLLVSAAIVRGRVGPAVAAGGVLFFWLLPSGPLRAAPAGTEWVAETESAYQFLQVLRAMDGDATVTTLKINEGLDSFHSLARSDTAWTRGAYYDWHTAAAVLARDGVPSAPASLRVLSLGAAAGTFARVFGVAFPGCTVDGVEIDPAVVELGQRHFGARGAAGVDVGGLDARVFVAQAGVAYDVVLVDAYARQIYIPAHVASREFFTAVRGRLVPGGVVSVNAGGLGFDDPVLSALGRTMASVFGTAHAFRVPFSRNFVLVARRDQPLARAVLRTAASSDAELGRVLAQMADDAHWRVFQVDGAVLDDDRPVLDALQHASYGEAAAERVTLTAATGGGDPAAVGETARAHLVAGRAEACLAELGTASAMTPYLRLLAGDARWALHDAGGARAELRAAEAAGVDEGLGPHLARRLATVEEFLASTAAARAAGTRNGWLAVAGAAALLALGFGLVRVARG